MGAGCTRRQGASGLQGASRTGLLEHGKHTATDAAASTAQPPRQAAAQRGGGQRASEIDGLSITGDGTGSQVYLRRSTPGSHACSSRAWSAVRSSRPSRSTRRSRGCLAADDRGQRRRAGAMPGGDNMRAFHDYKRPRALSVEGTRHRPLPACLRRRGDARRRRGTRPGSRVCGTAPDQRGRCTRTGRPVATRLGGTWLYQADPGDVGLSQGWWGDVAATTWLVAGDGAKFLQRREFHLASMDGYVGWYRRDFTLPSNAFANSEPASARHWIIRFESVNYRATVWLNGHGSALTCGIPPVPNSISRRAAASTG